MKAEERKRKAAKSTEKNNKKLRKWEIERSEKEQEKRETKVLKMQYWDKTFVLYNNRAVSNLLERLAC